MKRIAYIATCVSTALLIASMLQVKEVTLLYAVLLLPFATTLLAFHTRGDVQLWSIAVAFCLNSLGAAFCIYLIVVTIAAAAWASIQSIAGFVHAFLVLFYWLLPFRHASVALLSLTTFFNVWALTRLWKANVSAAA